MIAPGTQRSFVVPHSTGPGLPTDCCERRLISACLCVVSDVRAQEPAALDRVSASRGGVSGVRYRICVRCDRIPITHPPFTYVTADIDFVKENLFRSKNCISLCQF